jgi:hypothetical protein
MLEAKSHKAKDWLLAWNALVECGIDTQALNGLPSILSWLCVHARPSISNQQIKHQPPLNNPTLINPKP